MDEVVDILQENSDGEIGGTPMDDSKIFLYMIPVFAVVFLLSAILYSSSEKKRIAAGKKNLPMFLSLEEKAAYSFEESEVILMT